MNFINTLKVVVPTAGIAGIVLIIFYYLFREVIQKNIFPKLTSNHAFRLLRLFLWLVFALTIFVVSVWAYLTRGQESKLAVPTVISNHYSKNTKEAFFEWQPIGNNAGFPHWELLDKTDNNGLIEIISGRLPMDRNSKRVDLSDQKRELPDELFLRMFLLDTGNHRLIEGEALALKSLD